ncbi:DUF5347 family protein [Hafnia paralvei]|uniref:DUF5347 family protein n=1 Tax=Hafnia TaxID=568 RepID=UPI0005D94508|nr:DUF5347 family protein [Hafnia sp. HMSC23F03]AJR01981.1 hypothetical protein F652_3992 [Enterobacteriaceae bacterium bta3-1]OFS11329.1 hypothetical protein HMPREF3091_06410 [Hafnia sp. HMSC23F03]
MANTEAARTVQINAGDRFKGLNHVAAIRGKLFGDDGGKDLQRFILNMRDTTDACYLDNKRGLGAIFYLAKIPADRHDVEFSELTSAEIKALICAMNQLKAIVSLFPKCLAMPN